MMKQEIVDKIHIKYLSKAKTAVIDGSELTVLPYGFLQEACKEAMQEYALQIAEQAVGAEKSMYNPTFQEHILLPLDNVLSRIKILTEQ